MFQCKDGVLTFPTRYDMTWLDERIYDYLGVEVCSVKCVFDAKIIVLSNKIKILSISCWFLPKITSKCPVKPVVVDTRECGMKSTSIFFRISRAKSNCFFIKLGHYSGRVARKGYITLGHYSGPMARFGLNCFSFQNGPSPGGTAVDMPLYVYFKQKF
jgi:hypothetical protein